MIKAFMLLIALLFVPGSVCADGWIDLFSSEQHDSWCVTIPTNTPYVNFTIYVFARPPVEGMRGIVFRINLPDSTLMIVSRDYYPRDHLIIGKEEENGVAIAFVAPCIHDPWVLIAQYSILVNPPGISEGCKIIRLEPQIEYPFLGFATCEYGYPEVWAAHAVDVYINCEPCPDIIATKKSSWGAIKSMFE